MDYSCEDIAKMIDHSLLRPELTDEDIVAGCEVARKYQVAAVCCRPSDVSRVKELLQGSGVKVDAVVGFPHGSHKTKTKVFEAEEAIKDGAEELDMVIHIGKLRSRDFDYVRNDIKAIADVAHSHGVILKVILENCYLDDELKEIGCKLAEEAGADFVKTSTGFGTPGVDLQGNKIPVGATTENVVLMRKTVGSNMGVKAAGGIHSLKEAEAMVKAGANRLGCSAGVIIAQELEK